MERRRAYSVKTARSEPLACLRILNTTIIRHKPYELKVKAMDDRAYSLLKAELGRRLSKGERGFRLKEIAEAVGLKFQALEAGDVFKELCSGLEIEGLVEIAHINSREPNYADLVRLTEFGSDPDAWED
jgi:hypothetical protein